MREVTCFIVVFPSRLALISPVAKRAVLDELGRSYPHYSFKSIDGRAIGDDDEFGVIPVVGTAGDLVGGSDEVFMCKPLDPRVIPDIANALRQIELGGGRC